MLPSVSQVRVQLSLHHFKPFVYILRSEIPKSYGSFISDFWGILYPLEMYSFSFPPRVYIFSLIFISSSTLVNLHLINKRNSYKHEMITYCDFACNSLIISDVEHVFICLLAVYIFLWNIYSGVLPIFVIFIFIFATELCEFLIGFEQ